MGVLLEDASRNIEHDQIITRLKKVEVAPSKSEELKDIPFEKFLEILDVELCERLAYDDIWYHSVLLNSHEIRDLGRRTLKELIGYILESHFNHQHSSGITLGLLLTPEVEVRVALYRGSKTGLAIIERGKTVKLGCKELVEKYIGLEGNAEVYGLPNYRLKEPRPSQRRR